MAHDDEGHSHLTHEAHDCLEDKLPVIVLTGCLGSGKTTLLNNLLTGQRERRLAVIQNEAGEVSIDDMLVEQKHADLAEELVVLDNGCVWCTFRGDLVRTLHDIAAKRKEGLELDGVLIELSGVADPALAVQTFLLDAEVRGSFYVDNVIALVDAKLGLQRLEESEEEETGKSTACAQILFSSMVLLNKIDLVSADELDQLETRIQSINSFADIWKCEQARVQVDNLFGVRTFDLARALAEQHMDEDIFCQFYKPTMDRSISSVGVRCTGALNMFNLETFLEKHLEEEETAKYFFRVKAVLNIKGADRMFVIQCVHMLRNQSFTKLWKASAPRENRIAFIGRGMEQRRQELTDDFLSCVAMAPRFEVGTRVCARTGPGEDDYTPGTILKQWDELNTYRIKLIDCREVHAPVDSDYFVKDLRGSQFESQSRRPVSFHARFFCALLLSLFSLYSIDAFSSPSLLLLSLVWFKSLNFNARLLFRVLFLAFAWFLYLVCFAWFFTSFEFPPTLQLHANSFVAWAKEIVSEKPPVYWNGADFVRAAG